MTRFRRVRSISARLAKAVVGLVAFVLILVGIGLAVLQTAWAKEAIRGLIVRQANQYLTATLSIGRLEGSLLRGIALADVSVAREGRTLIQIERIALSYSIRELVQTGVVVRRVQLTRPRIVGGRQPDGRWDLGALVRRDTREQERTGPSRPIEVQSIEIVDGRISLRDPLDFGAAHVPTEFEALNAKFAFAYFPVRWRLTFDHVSWIGRAPDLSVQRAGRSVRAGTRRLVLRAFLGRHGALRLHTRRTDRHVTEADRARAAGARAALCLSGVVGRPARSEEHRGRGIVRHVADGSGRISS